MGFTWSRTVLVLGALLTALSLVVALMFWSGQSNGERGRVVSVDVPTGPTPAAAPPPASATPAPTTRVPVAPKRTTSAPKPVTGGKPGADNTGVPAGVRLRVVTGNQTYGRDNQVISGLDIRGYVRITGRNVTLKNSIVRGGAKRCNAAVIHVEDDASATVQDTEIRPENPNACLDGVWAENATLVRLDIHDVVDGVKAFDNVTLRDSWVHNLSFFASDPNQGGGSTHNDAVQTYEANRNILLRHNTLDVGRRGNAAYQLTQDGGRAAANIRIEDNWLDGGGCTLNFSHKGGPTPMTGIHVTGNRFGPNSVFNCPILLSTGTRLSRNSGNTWTGSGRAIPSPQRHD
jgi:hypothetical protein